VTIFAAAFQATQHACAEVDGSAYVTAADLAFFAESFRAGDTNTETCQ
jgi:hypothetical protein